MAAVDSFDGGASGYLNAATAETDAVWSETAADDGVVKAFNGSDDDPCGRLRSRRSHHLRAP